MAKTILGVDIGSDSIKLALCRGGRVLKTAVAQTPGSLVKEGHVTSPESMGELLHETMKKNGIRASHAAFILAGEQAYVRTITSPIMTVEQLALNIPYEFSDYINDELKNYIFDYAMLSDPRKSEDGKMELMAVAVPRVLLTEVRNMLRKSGLKLYRAATAECAYISLIRRQEALHQSEPREYCIIDLGFRSIRMYMFRGERHIVTRLLELGLDNLDSVIAENMGVDRHLAHTYLLTNYNDCQNAEFSVNAYDRVAVELMRSLNFYRFSTPDSHLEDVWICGGGYAIEPLRRMISDTLRMTVHEASELLEGDVAEAPYSFVRAVGITIE